MKLRWGKKGIEIPIHWLIIFVIFLIILIAMAVSSYQKSGGLLNNLFSALRGG